MLHIIVMVVSHWRRKMNSKLYVGNLSYSTTEDELRNLFFQAGTVASVALIKDRETGRSKGFAFVEMSSETEAKRAIAAVHGTVIDERTVNVNEARPKEQKDNISPGEMRRHRDHRY